MKILKNNLIFVLTNLIKLLICAQIYFKIYIHPLLLINMINTENKQCKEKLNRD
jgi:hypothetical protein